MVKYYLLILISFWQVASFANDECPNAITLTPGSTCSYTSGTFNGATLSGTAPSCTPNASQDVWFKFTATDATNRISFPYTPGADVAFQILQGGCNGTVVTCINYDGFNQAETYANNNFIIGQEYYIRVLNANAQLSTADFFICVTTYPAPANDICANAPQITPNTECSYVSGTVSGALIDGSTASCAGNALQDVWYKFTATDAIMSISMTYSPGIDQAFQILQGGCNGTVMACVNSQGLNQEESFMSNGFIIGQEYYIRILNTGGTLSTSNFQLCLKTYPAPANDLCANAIQITPNVQCGYQIGTISGALKDGGDTGCATDALQDVWYKFTATDATMGISMTYSNGINQAFQVLQGGCNGTVVACVNNQGYNQEESYIGNNFIIGQEYYLRVMNAGGFTSTSNFQFCVTAYPAPANDLCSNASEIIPGEGCTYVGGTFTGAMNEGTSISCAANFSQDIWYKFVATEQTYGVYLSPVSGLDLGFEIIQGDCQGTVIACVNNNGFSTSEAYLNNNFIIGQTYYLRFFSMYTVSTANITMCVTKYAKPANDTCSNATVLYQNASCSAIGATLTGAMPDDTATVCAVNSSQDVWFRFTAQGNSAWINVGPVISHDLGFEVYQGGCDGTVLQCINSNGINVSETGLISNLLQGTEYYIRVINVNQAISIENFTICVYGNVQPCTPSVSIAASTTAVCAGSPVIFTATPTYGGSMPQYQWKINETAVGTGDTYTTATLTSTDMVTVTMTSNAACAPGTAVISNTVSIDVTPQAVPAFTQIAAVCAGTPFTLPAVSSNGITGSWSPAVNNSATTTYTFTPNAGQCAATATMTVVVNAYVTPAFTQIGTICSGTSFTLPSTSNNGVTGTWSPSASNTVTATYAFTPNAGQCAFSATMTVTVNTVDAGVTVQGNTITANAAATAYQWVDCSGNQPITGATTMSFTPSQTGSYAVIVTQNSCSEISACTAITILGSETFQKDGWNIYPNPATNHLFIKLNETTDIMITDMTGKIVQRQSLKSGDNTVDVSRLCGGVYLIRDVSGGVVKFVKK